MHLLTNEQFFAMCLITFAHPNVSLEDEYKTRKCFVTFSYVIITISNNFLIFVVFQPCTVNDNRSSAFSNLFSTFLRNGNYACWATFKRKGFDVISI